MGVLLHKVLGKNIMRHFIGKKSNNKGFVEALGAGSFTLCCLTEGIFMSHLHDVYSEMAPI